ncbi:hypothetical protein [Desmospora profundinema]|uniref:Uncharacterized protein n=1 Tax=Desmospora profundinema TaxID=1571184 RepID=A0ABU1IQT6_9BACL|nr:hypothetical protein [Desmospora profundinema]MDR6227162.1 hypothetical protein [Desmospora profundinema]
MGLTQWKVDVDGEKRIVQLQHKGKKGTVQVDGDPVMEWKIPRLESSHHLTRIGSRLLGIHLYEDLREAAGWRYDCSLDGLSVVTQNSVWIRESTPYNGGYRRWDIDLCGQRIQIGMRHKVMTGSILLELNRDPVTNLTMDIRSDEGDAFLPMCGHRVGIHIRETEDFSFRYDCSVDGRSVTTGQMIAPARLLANEGGFAWMGKVDETSHLFRFEHRPFRSRATLWVDGKEAGSTGPFWEDRKESWYSFRWSGHHVMVQVREMRDFEYEYLLVLDGRSLITGESVQPPEITEPEITEVEAESTHDAWDLELTDGPHRVEVDGTFTQRIRVDGVEVAKTSLWDLGDSWHPFAIGKHSCAVLFQPGTFTHRAHLFVDGTNAATGEDMLPLKVIPAGGRPKWWMFRTPQGVRRVELHHQWWWLGGVCQIRVDGEPVLKKRRWNPEATFHFYVDGLSCQMQIEYDPADNQYDYHLWVDGNRIETGKVVPAEQEEKSPQPPAAPSWRKRLRSAVGIYLFGVAALYVLHSLARWLGWAEPRELLWYFTLPLISVFTYLLHGSKAEKWVYAVMIIAVAGFGIYFWITD